MFTQTPDVFEARLEETLARPAEQVEKVARVRSKAMVDEARARPQAPAAPEEEKRAYARRRLVEIEALLSGLRIEREILLGVLEA